MNWRRQVVYWKEWDQKAISGGLEKANWYLENLGNENKVQSSHGRLQKSNRQLDKVEKKMQLN